MAESTECHSVSTCRACARARPSAACTCATDASAPARLHRNGNGRGHVLVEVLEDRRRAGWVAPVALELGEHGHGGEHLHAREAHAVVRGVRAALVDCPRRVRVRKDFEARLAQGECEEGRADLCAEHVSDVVDG